VKRVLVTGATGFVGRHAIRLLEARGYEVHATFHRQRGDLEVDGIGVDLLDPRDIDWVFESVQPSHLLHFAWYAVPGKFWTAPENAAWVEASIRLLRGFTDHGGVRAVMTGSCAEYDWTGTGVLSERDTPLRPATYYGQCKAALASVGEGLAAERGFDFAWGRIFFAYGPHEQPGRLVSQVAEALVKGEPAPTSEGTQRRDFMHARDVADAFVALLDSGVTGPVNIGSGAAVPVRDLVSLIAEAAGRPDLVRFGEVPQRPGDPPLIEADVTRLRDEVGWRPVITLETGIRETVEWWKANV
jgi:nucleoside-diphosphate-sugar epimerase